MDISYGILDYNPDADPHARALLQQCIESLSRNRSPRFKTEVFLIEQGNRRRDYCKEVAQLCYQHGFNYLELIENVGISRGINYIAKLARGKFISLVTSDVIFASGTDEALIGEFERHPELYQVTPAVSGSSLPYQVAEGVTGAPIKRCIANELTIQFWRREAFEEIGFWDERWKACYENNDWTMRLFLSGHDTAISFNTFCHHHQNATTKNGAIWQAYEGYIEMKGGLDHRVLRQMWNKKWDGLDWHFMYNPGRLTEQSRSELHSRFKQNIWLPYIQQVGY